MVKAPDWRHVEGMETQVRALVVSTIYLTDYCCTTPQNTYNHTFKHTSSNPCYAQVKSIQSIKIYLSTPQFLPIHFPIYNWSALYF